MVPAILAALDDESPDVRARAAFVLGWIGPAAKAAVPALVRSLRDPCRAYNFGFRGDEPPGRPISLCAVEALFLIGPEARAAVPALTEALQHPDARVRHAATLALWRLGPHPRPTPEAIAAALLDWHLDVRRAGVRTLAGLKADERNEVRRLLLDQVWQRGPASDPATAIRALRWFGTEAIPDLVRLLDREMELGFSGEVFEVLGSIGSPAVPALVAVLRDEKEASRRSSAVMALGQMGPAARAAVPALRAALQDEEEGVRGAAIYALANVAPSSPEVVPALVKDLQSDNIGRQLRAVWKLAEVGEAARPALPALRLALRDPEQQVRLKAAVPLLRLAGDQQALDLLLHDAADHSPNYRGGALVALGEVGPAAKKAVPLLIRCLRDPEPFTHLFAAEALGKIGPDAGAAIPALAANLRAPDTDVRLKAAFALIQVGGDRRAALACLLAEVRSSPNRTLRCLAVDLVGEIGPEAKEAVPALLDLLYDDDFWPSAARALRKIDPDALRRELAPVPGG
jgi:HEAT repeat protein